MLGPENVLLVSGETTNKFQLKELVKQTGRYPAYNPALFQLQKSLWINLIDKVPSHIQSDMKWSRILNNYIAGTIS